MHLLANELASLGTGRLSFALSISRPLDSFFLRHTISSFVSLDERDLLLMFLFVLHNTAHSKRLRELLARTDIPVVETGNLPAKPIDMAVSYSNFDAARAMTGHLGRLGYKRIGFVTLPLRDNDRSRERRRGYLAALKELGLAADPGLVLEAPGGLPAPPSDDLKSRMLPSSLVASSID